MLGPLNITTLDTFEDAKLVYILWLIDAVAEDASETFDIRRVRATWTVLLQFTGFCMICDIATISLIVHFYCDSHRRIWKHETAPPGVMCQQIFQESDELVEFCTPNMHRLETCFNESKLGWTIVFFLAVTLSLLTAGKKTYINRLFFCVLWVTSKVSCRRSNKMYGIGKFKEIMTPFN